MDIRTPLFNADRAIFWKQESYIDTRVLIMQSHNDRGVSVLIVLLRAGETHLLTWCGYQLLTDFL